MVQAIVGGNWGDEGKGKMTDLLAGSADIVVRFQGGANAGHTIINKYGKLALHLLPSGIFRENTVNVIAQGVAVDLDALFEEIDDVLNIIPRPIIRISNRAEVLMPYHVLFDELEEKRLGENSFGSTKSGIAPFYADKYSKIGIQVCDLFNDELLLDKLEGICETKNVLLEHLYKAKIRLDPYEIRKHITKHNKRLQSMLIDSTLYLNKAIAENKSILLEGQLGALRDPDNGIYPFTTSSSPLAGFGSVGAGIPPHAITEITAVVKAYSSCVGAGAFVTEIFGKEAEQLRNLGGDTGEYGAKTGRPRRVGWFDVVASRYGCMLQGATNIALSLVDVLGYLDRIPICVGYDINGVVADEFPSTPDLIKAKPIYEYLEGWKCDISNVRNYDELPQNARNYIEFIENKLSTPIKYISNGPKRDDIIIR